MQKLVPRRNELPKTKVHGKFDIDDLGKDGQAAGEFQDNYLLQGKIYGYSFIFGNGKLRGFFSGKKH